MSDTPIKRKPGRPKGVGRQKYIVTPRPRKIPITPNGMVDILREIEAAADMITQAGHKLNVGIGYKWNKRAVDVWRMIMAFREQAEKEWRAERARPEFMVDKNYSLTQGDPS